MIKSILIFIQSNLYPFPILINLEFSQQIFEKYSNIKFHDNRSSEKRVVLCGQTNGRTDTWTERHDEAKGLFSQLCQRA